MTPAPLSSGGTLIDVLDRVLDKGIVIDASVRVALVGVDLISVDARLVIASIETYLRYSDQLAATALAARPHNVVPIAAEPLPGERPAPEAPRPGTPRPSV